MYRLAPPYGAVHAVTRVSGEIANSAKRALTAVERAKHPVVDHRHASQ